MNARNGKSCCWVGSGFRVPMNARNGKSYCWVGGALRNSHDKWPEPVRKRVEKNLHCEKCGKDDIESSHQVVKI
jgi:hypothetical protein